MNNRATSNHLVRILKTALALGLLCVHGPGIAALSASEQRALFPYMVKVKASPNFGKDKHGFGVILYEPADSGFVYIATPKHVVLDLDSRDQLPLDQITVTYYHADIAVTAEYIDRHDRDDLALLRAPRPAGLEWYGGVRPAETDKGKNVVILGYDWRWETRPQAEHYPVSHLGFTDLEIAASVEVNSSGALIANSKGIVGMITANDREKGVVLALRMDYIVSEVFERWLKQNIEPELIEDEFPQLGLDFGGTGAMILTSLGESNPGIMYGGEIGLTLYATPRYGLRLSHFDGRISANSEFELTGQSSRFHNNFTIDMIHLLFNFERDLSLISSMKKREYFYGMLGLGLGKHDPELNLNKSGYRALDSYGAFEGKYEEDFLVFEVGVRFEDSWSEHVYWGASATLAFTDTEYLGIDVDQPFDENDVKDFYVKIGVFLNIIFGGRSSQQFKALI